MLTYNMLDIVQMKYPLNRHGLLNTFEDRTSCLLLQSVDSEFIQPVFHRLMQRIKASLAKGAAD